MKFLRDTRLYLWLLAVGIGLFVWSLRLNKNYSRSPQELLHKLSLAVQENDESKISALFDNRQSFEKFSRAGIEYIFPQTMPIIPTRAEQQDSLKAWQRWFKIYGVSSLKCEDYKAAGLTDCAPDSHSFVIVIKRTSCGFIIQDCAFLAA